MITPKELLEKSSKQFYKIVSSDLKGENMFPLVINANKNITSTKFSDLKAAILPLYQNSKDVKRKGYSVEWKEKKIEGSKQKVPAKIFFENIEDYLFYTQRATDYAAIKNAFHILVAAFPELSEWAKNNVVFLHNHTSVLVDLIKVLNYFSHNRPPHNLYLRELPIEVHSKFIEDNSAALKKILDILLPQDWINKIENDFEKRYYIKKTAVYTQIRILDDNLKQKVGFDELALTVEDFALLDWQPEQVFIIENKACFLSFPKIKNSVAIFGEGFKSRISKQIPWLNKTKLYCWFDLDAAGFEMLNMIREHYPKAVSFLMDKSTFQRFNQFSVEKKWREKQVQYLLLEEIEMYRFLVDNSKRLEQERIPQQYVSDLIQKSAK